MLSIIIPNYNYDVYPLVIRLWQQCNQLGINYEILVQEDGVANYSLAKKILNKPNCNYEANKANFGVCKTRNILITKAKNDWILLLDSDTKPVNEDFVKKYIEYIDKGYFFSGGIEYQDSKPNKEELLRWVYGKKREAIPIDVRTQNPYQHILCSNILFDKRKVKILFDETITTYGHEDLIFFKELKKRKISVYHIQNPVYHLKLDSSKVFLKKTEEAMRTLYDLVRKNKIDPLELKITLTFLKLRKTGLCKPFSIFFKVFEPLIKKNLLSSKPFIFLLDLYKLGYYQKNSY